MRLILVLSLSLYFSLFTIARTNRSRLCVDEDAGLQWLSSRLSEDSTITCRQNRQTADSTGRYWAAQLVNDASVVVTPASSEDVSLAVQATMKTPLGRDYAFVSGGHSLTGASSSRGLVIDLKRLNHTTVLHNFTDPMTQRGITVVMYEGGVTSFGLQSAVNGTGWTAVTPRASSVGMGGFSTGGGIGFMANAYGYAIDRLVALEVVLPSGEIVIATKENKHSDLFWAIQGGSGQFGIVTKFYQKAFRTPKNVKVGFHVVGNGSVTQSFRNTEVFFARHTDPFSLMYYALAYLPIGWPHAREEEMGFRVTRLMVTLRFEEPEQPHGAHEQPQNTFRTLFSGLSLDSSLSYTVPFADLTTLSDSFFPAGYRRGFWGPQVINVTETYLSAVDDSFRDYIDAMLTRGETPSTSTWVLQYMLPGLNGHLPASDADTAWPHSVAGHQTLFDPGWHRASSDSVVEAFNEVLYSLARREATTVGSHNRNPGSSSSVRGLGPPYDYPNYIKPHAKGEEVWGQNTARLASVKQKYDPECLLHKGRVFSSPGCVSRGFANVF